MPRITNLDYAEPWIELASTPQDWKKLGKTELLRVLYYHHLVRAFEEAVLNLEKLGLVHGPAHSSIGQEGGAVGSVMLLNSSDMITGAHRGHHQFLVKGMQHIDSPSYDPRAAPLPEEVQTFLYRTLAEILGLSDGFCKGRGGSMHLRWVEAGAMGTNAIVGGGVPIANGLAWAQKRRNKGEVTFTFFGDGGMNIGAVPESMNLAALWNLPICFFIENNGYAVSTTLEEETRETRLSSRGGAYAIPAWRVDGMDPVAVRLASEAAIERMRAGKGPTIIEAVLYRYFHHGGSVAGSAFGYRKKDEESSWIAKDPLDRTVREMINLQWLTADENTAIRRHCESAMQGIVERLVEGEGSKRRIRAELWPKPEFRDQGLRGDLSEFKDARFEELETASGPVGDVKFVDAVARVMGRRMETDERVFCMGEDIHRLKGGTNGATKGLAERFPDRIIPAPIAEQGFVGLAGGVAQDGQYRPVVELMYSDFALVAADQLFNQIGKARHMFGGDSAVPLVLRTKCAIGTGYGSQHSMDPAGMYAMWPGWRIVAPSTPFDYVGLMNSALKCEDPVLVIEHTDLYNTTDQGPLEDLDYCIELGKAKVVRKGSAFTVLTYLAMTPLALKVADEMGLDVEIIDLRSLDRAGIDWATIGESIRKTNNVVVLEQGPLTVSYGAMLTDEIQRRFFDYLDQPVQRIHGGESSPSVSKVLERAAFVGAEEIRAGFTRMMADMGQPLPATPSPAGNSITA
ncbi:alpha-ketoacid dehydrogenase subunit alpha/beta [Aromatoleum anaerobium]|uniref:Dehydrogenase n=1 Tax=Aromatoleum anaerobium TaxID=182180 RepID=A0N0U3_9RHOO|nr:alpha-ketoacid dehydrogenase subunit alpha/beta [Aromatoleum anaerobium]ABK58621.1 dehydrogenase [Aromatoleum anaerobium]MCK0505380.1 thiamine pyrophosphate-dependent enzyme [Aromatoleum anaerobium]